MSTFRKEELTGIAPVAIDRYLYLLGWIYDSTFPNKKVRKYVHPKEPDLQIWVPVRQSFSDYYRRISDIIGLLSEWYEKDASEILKELHSTYFDHLEFRIRYKNADSGKIPLYCASKYITGISNLIFDMIYAVQTAQKSDSGICAREKAKNLFLNFDLERNQFSNLDAERTDGRSFSFIAGVKVADNKSDCAEAPTFPLHYLAPSPEHYAVKQLETVLEYVCNITNTEEKVLEDESDAHKAVLTENMCKSFLGLWTDEGSDEGNAELEIIIRYASAVCADGMKVFVFGKRHFESLRNMLELFWGNSKTVELIFGNTLNADFTDDSEYIPTSGTTTEQSVVTIAA